MPVAACTSSCCCSPWPPGAAGRLRQRPPKRRLSARSAEWRRCCLQASRHCTCSPMISTAATRWGAACCVWRVRSDLCLECNAVTEPQASPHLSFSTAFAQVCSTAEVLRGTFPTFSLPTDGQHLSLLLALSSLDCSSGQRGVLLSLGGSASTSSSNSSSPAVVMAVDCAEQQLLLSSSGLGTATYNLPALSSSNGSLLLLSQNRQQASFGVCVDGQQLPALADSSPALLQHLAGSGSPNLLGDAVVIGARSDSARSARADLAALYVADLRIACQQTLPGDQQAALLYDLAAAAAAARDPEVQPSLAVVQQPAEDGVVGEPLHLHVTATPGSGALADTHRWESRPAPAASAGGLLYQIDQCKALLETGALMWPDAA